MPLTSRISPEAKRTIEVAFNDLKDALSATDYAQLKDTTLGDVQDALHKLEEYLSARGWVRNLRRLLPLITVLGHYHKTIEVLCNGTPFLPWIWAPIKLILKVSSDHLDAFEQIIKTYASISEPLTRFKVYNAAYSEDKDVQQVLALFYADILRFHKAAYKLIRRGGWHILFTTSFGRFKRQFDSIFDDLKHHEDLIDKTVNAAGIRDIRRLREDCEAEQETRRHESVKREEKLTATHLLDIITLLRVDDAQQADVFETIAAEANAGAGFGCWALKQVRIRSWASLTDDTKFLILHGHPGTGKSVIAAQIAKFVLLSGKSVVLTHFCTYLYPESTRYEDILRVITLQLIRNSPELIAHAHHDLLTRKRTPSCAVLEQLLVRLVNAAAPSQSQKTVIHLIVDGLSECAEETQMKVFKMLQKLVASVSGSSVFKVLVCTRAISAIGKSMRGQHQVSLTDEKKNLTQGISDYIGGQLESLKPKLGHLRFNPGDMASLQVQIVEKSDGMILWAKLVLEYIASNVLVSRDEVFQAAASFPRGLTQLYGRILSQVTSKFDHRSSFRLQMILGWIAFAKRPLRQTELLSALTFSLNNGELVDLVPSYVLDMCAPLVEKKGDTTYRFIHGSVRDFLQMPDSPLKLNENVISQGHGLASVRCLLATRKLFAPSYTEHDRIIKIVRGIHAFSIYATEFWLDYLLSLLSISDTTPGPITSEFIQLSCQLAAILGYKETEVPKASASSLRDPAESLLDLIKIHNPSLFLMSRAIFESRQRTSLDPSDIKGGEETSEPRSLDQLKFYYQSIVRRLLISHGYGEISAAELERFKYDSRQCAFTCCLSSCPRATVGFGDGAALASHESQHYVHTCTFPGCQYPVFSSHAALQRYFKKHHDSTTPVVSSRKSIRKRIQMGATIKATHQSEVQDEALDTKASSSARITPRYSNLSNNSFEFERSFVSGYDGDQSQLRDPDFMESPSNSSEMFMGMANSAGLGIPSIQQISEKRSGQNFSTMPQLAPSDRAKVTELANMMMFQASNETKQSAMNAIRAKLTPQQLQEMQANNKDPMLMYYQQQAFNLLRRDTMRRQQGSSEPQVQAQDQNQDQNQYHGQAAAMQERPHIDESMPSHIMEVSPADLVQVKKHKPQFANVPDEQLRVMVLAMKRQAWQQYRNERMMDTSMPGAGTRAETATTNGSNKKPQAQLNDPPSKYHGQYDGGYSV